MKLPVSFPKGGDKAAQPKKSAARSNPLFAKQMRLRASQVRAIRSTGNRPPRSATKPQLPSPAASLSPPDTNSENSTL